MRQLGQKLIHRRKFKNRIDGGTKKEVTTCSLLESADDDHSTLGLQECQSLQVEIGQVRSLSS